MKKNDGKVGVELSAGRCLQHKELHAVIPTRRRERKSGRGEKSRGNEGRGKGIKGEIEVKTLRSLSSFSCLWIPHSDWLRLSQPCESTDVFIPLLSFFLPSPRGEIPIWEDTRRYLRQLIDSQPLLSLFQWVGSTCRQM